MSGTTFAHALSELHVHVFGLFSGTVARIGRAPTTWQSSSLHQVLGLAT